MKKYTKGYVTSQVLGILSLVCAFIILHPTAGAVLAMVGFMLIWFPAMLPDHEKYTQEYQKQQLVDRFNKKYGKGSYDSSANDEYV